MLGFFVFLSFIQFPCRNRAFFGGIDLAYNRWDDAEHSLSDELGVKYVANSYIFALSIVY